MPWPRMSGADFRHLMKRIGGRFDKVVAPLIAAQTDKTSVRSFLRVAVWSAHDRIMKYIETAILADLVRRDQITGWELPDAVVAAATAAGGDADDVRLILAALVSGTAGDLPDRAALASSTRLTPKFVDAVLAALQGVGADRPFRVIPKESGGRTTYALQLNASTGIRRLPLIGDYLERWLPEPYRYA